MSGRMEDIDFTAPQRIAANLIASTLCNGGTEALLDAQADMLKGVGAAMSQWLQRRQEAIAEAQRLMARMRDSRDVTDILKAQEEWVSGALQRFTADLTTYPSLLAKAGARATEEARRAAPEFARQPKAGPAEPAQRSPDPPKPASARAPRIGGSESARAPAPEDMHTH